MRILVVAPAIAFPSKRGAALRVSMMVRSLARLGHEVHIVASHLGERWCQENPALHRADAVPGVRKLIVGLAPGRFLVDIALFRKTASAMREIDPDVVWGEDVEGTLCGALAVRGRETPLVYDMHNSLTSLLEARGAGLLVPPLRPLERWLYKKSSHIVANWHDSLSAVSRLAPESQATVIHDRLPRSVEARWEAPNLRSQAFIYCGNFVPYQRVDLIIKAFNLVARRHSEAQLVLVGPDPPAKLESLAEYPQKIIFTGELPIEKANYLLSCAFAAVLATRGNTPMKLIHYLQFGRPVVGTENNFEPGVFEHEFSGLLCEPEARAMADAMLRLLEDESSHRRLVQNATGVANERLSEKALDKAMQEVLEAAVGSRAAQCVAGDGPTLQTNHEQ